ncbi:MAG: EcoAI/FtnUII family type I restriction enzme subunit R [Candidatus Woesearchaeota archaeon]
MTSEADIRENKVIPKLEESNWNKNQLEREFPIKSKRYYVNGEEYLEVEPPKKFADVLLKVNNVIVGVVEVKKDTKNAEDGIAQAKDYAQRLDVPISFATNGSTILMYDRRTLQVTEVDSYLTPEELFTIYKEFKQLPENISPLEQPNFISPNTRLRSYQETAVKNVIESITKGNKKVLLTMATGTGKTFTSFQIVWKLIKSNYFTRILFLTDRIFLRDQAHDDFEPLGNARTKIKGNNYEKNRKVYFSTYQTLYKGDLYKNIPEDFFDLIIIDECHRSRYGDWGEMLNHFNTAYNLGMTATPKREDNIDVYKYFGEPVFTYSLAQAIEDGYLVPYKLYKITSNIDKNGLIINSGLDIVYDDEIQLEKLKVLCPPSQFERTITLPDRTEFMTKKFIELLNKTDKHAKTIIFCVDMDHAQDITNKINQIMEKEDFATRIVSEEKDDLTIFRDAEREFPLIATTVDLLSTGIDIPHLRNIVFMKPVASTVLFKQIIGRGSRLSKNKGFFRIIDFTNASRLLDEWDLPGKATPKEKEDPEEPYNKTLKGYVVDVETNDRIESAKVKVKVGRFQKEEYTVKDGFFELNELPSNKTVKTIITADKYKHTTKRVETNKDVLAFELKPERKKPRKIKISGVNVNIAEEVEIEIDGNSISKAEYKQYIKDNILELTHDLKDLKEIWIDDKKRKEFLETLKEKEISVDVVKYLEDLDNSDGFDILAHLVFDVPLLTSEERVKRFMNLNSSYLSNLDYGVKDVVLNILEKYKKDGVENITPDVLTTPDMKEKNSMHILREKVGIKNISGLLKDIKELLYTSV